MNYLDFMPLGKNRAGQVGNLTGGAWAQWATTIDFCDYWGPPTWQPPLSEEVYGIGQYGNQQWLTLTRLGPYPLRTVMARTQIGKDVLTFGEGPGHPYALINFVPHSIEVWGYIEKLKFYWRAEYSLVRYQNPLLGVTMDCIRQSEIWGNDDYFGNWKWSRGTPLPETAEPFEGEHPVTILTRSNWFQGIGKGYGPGWVMGDVVDGKDVVTACAQNFGWSHG